MRAKEGEGRGEKNKHSVRFFSFNLFICASNISAPKPPKCPPNLMWCARKRSYSV